nr:hypothetical protein [Aeromicrobium sp.]
MRRSAAVLVAVAFAALSACGSDASSDDDAKPSSANDAKTSLTIVVTPDQGAEASTYELTCDPAGGDHPQPQAACDALAAAGAEVFDAVPSDQACTAIFGGPQTATVKGSFDGKDVDATFKRSDGCEIERWEQLGTTFFNVPLQ